MVKLLSNKNGVVSVQLEDGTDRVVVLNDLDMRVFPPSNDEKKGRLVKVSYDDAIVMGEALRVIFADSKNELNELRKQRRDYCSSTKFYLLPSGVHWKKPCPRYTKKRNPNIVFKS
jgi:hypothetical protein